MDIKGKISLMLKSKGFGEMFLYSINHKNSLVDAGSLKAKNLDSLKYIMRVTTIEKLLGKSSEEEVAWKDYKELYKSVCGSIDTLKKYCSALEKQSETSLKKRIEKYNEQKERLQAQIEFLTKMQPANAGYTDKKVIAKNIKAIDGAAAKFNIVRGKKPYKEWLEKSGCKGTVMDYTSFKPAAKRKTDGGMPDAPHFAEFLKMQKEIRNEEFIKINGYINTLVKQEMQKEMQRKILECQEKVGNTAGKLAKLVDIDMRAIGELSQIKSESLYNNLASALALKINNSSKKPLISSSEEFRKLVSAKLASKEKFSKKDFPEMDIKDKQLKWINDFRELWNTFEENFAELSNITKGKNINAKKGAKYEKTKKAISEKLAKFKEHYDEYINEIEKCCKLQSKVAFKDGRPIEYDAKIKSKKSGFKDVKVYGFEDMKALEPFMGKSTLMDRQLAELNKNASKINAEIAKFKKNYESASKHANDIKRNIGMYVNQYEKKFSSKSAGLNGQIISDGQGKINLNGWKPPQDSLSLAQSVVTVYYYIDRYQNNSFNLFGSEGNYIDAYIEESKKLKLGFTPGKNK